MKHDKDVLRRTFLLKRKKLSSYDVFIKSWIAQENLLHSRLFLNSEVIGAYYPVLNEVKTFRIIARSLSIKKKVCLPKLHDDKILFFQINHLKDLTLGRYNIKEPLVDPDTECCEIDTVIIPGIVFDKYGYRIGYGKGYYDKFLNQPTKKNIVSIGLAYDFQIIPTPILHEKHDAKLNFLITNREMLSV